MATEVLAVQGHQAELPAFSIILEFSPLFYNFPLTMLTFLLASLLEQRSDSSSGLIVLPALI